MEEMQQDVVVLKVITANMQDDIKDIKTNQKIILDFIAELKAGRKIIWMIFGAAAGILAIVKDFGSIFTNIFHR